MSKPIISVRKIGKMYRLGETLSHNTLRDHLVHGLKSLIKRNGFLKTGPRNRPNQEEFWALKDVSFDVHQGEVVGIIGRNGAGKSTLLKILSEITEPTTGEIRIRGRVGSLLEVGTGFHPELTGRENIYLNGAILGMTRAEIKKKFDEIVDFAEIKKFLDTPVKRYSSGMYVRLAFAVAAHLEPDILVIDEVLAVGDAEFQRKCLGKIEEVAKQGRTVLFVSHNMTAVKLLCSSALLLEEGRIVFADTAGQTVSKYLEKSRLEERSVWLAGQNISGRTGNDKVQLIAARLAAFGIQSRRFHNGMPLAFDILLQVHKPHNFTVCAVLHREGGLVFNANTYHDNHKLNINTEGTYIISFDIEPYLLNPGFHTLDLYVADSHGADEHYVHCEKLISFYLEDDNFRRGGAFTGHWPGAVCPLLSFSVDRLKTLPEWVSSF